MELPELNRLSREHAFRLEDLDGSRPVDREKLWAPQATSPLSYLPGFAMLTNAQKTRYNQLFALGVCEQFIWFERDLLCPALKKAIERSKDFPDHAEFKTALGFFLEEEIKHAEMFWRLLEKSEPEFYRRRQFRFFNLSSFHRLALGFLTTFPRIFLAWIWIAIVFEEKTLDFSRHTALAERVAPGAIDFNFVQCHRYHLKDEIRHHRMDQHLIQRLYDRAGPWRRKLAGAVLRLILRSYSSPRRTSLAVLHQLGQEFPELERELIPRLSEELGDLAGNMDFQRMAFNRQSVGQSLTLLARYPEFDAIWELLKGVSKSEFAS